MHRQRIVARDRDRPAQPIHRQPSREVIRLRRLAIDQHVVAVGPEEEVEQRLALRGQQSAPSGKRSRDVAGDQTLEEIADVLAVILG